MRTKVKKVKKIDPSVRLRRLMRQGVRWLRADKRTLVDIRVALAQLRNPSAVAPAWRWLGHKDPAS